MDISTILNDGSNFAAIIGVFAAGVWFIYTAKFKRRVQLDIDCKLIRIDQFPGNLIAEIQLKFQNKGFVEHRLYDVTVSIHGLENDEEFSEDANSKKLHFPRRLLGKVSIIPQGYNYFFVRPAVEQIITHIVKLNDPGDVIRVTAGFYYDHFKSTPHTAQRIFKTT